MALYAGPSYCRQDICIGPPDLERVRAASIADDVRDAVAFYLEATPTRADISAFCIYQRGTPVGEISLHDIDLHTRESLVAYHLFLPDYRGHGIGTIALSLLQEHVRSVTTLTRLIVITSRDNLASQRTATKCQFQAAGPAREDPEHLLVFAWDVHAASTATPNE